MNWNLLLIAIAFLGCPIMMFVMMRMMNKQMGERQAHSLPDEQLPADPNAHVAALRQQRQMLDAEIAEATQVVELEAQRDALRNGRVSAPGNPTR